MYSISTTIMWYNNTLNCSHESGLHQTEECSSSLPLRCHSVHITVTSEIVSTHYPLRMIILLVPNYAFQFQIYYVQDLMRIRTPCLLNRSSPSLGYKRRDGEIGSKSVLENTAIYFIILIDSFDCIAINWSQIVFVK